MTNGKRTPQGSEERRSVFLLEQEASNATSSRLKVFGTESGALLGSGVELGVLVADWTYQ